MFSPTSTKLISSLGKIDADPNATKILSSTVSASALSSTDAKPANDVARVTSDDGGGLDKDKEVKSVSHVTALIGS